jgi:hypothetical protein
MTGSAPSTLILGTLLLGLLASLFWPLTRHLITMAHEGSHAFFGSLSGGSVNGVRLNPDGSGFTTVAGGWALLIGLSGYLGPPLLGIIGATMLANGVHPNVVLWVSLGLMAVVLLQMRSVFGWLAVLGTGVLFWMVVHYGNPTGRVVFVYTWVWFLLLGGFISTVETNLSRDGWSVDAGILRKITRIPRGIWGGLWWLATLAALIYGGGVLFGAIDPLIQVS